MKNQKINALIEYLEKQEGEHIIKEEITAEDEKSFYYFNEEYLVLTNEEAEELARETITEELWAFNADFILKNSNLDYNEANLEAIKLAQRELCEGANGFIKNIIEDLDAFIDEAICCDGRGHFLSYYDGKENELDGFYIYRR